MKVFLRHSFCETSLGTTVRLRLVVQHVGSPGTQRFLKHSCSDIRTWNESYVTFWRDFNIRSDIAVVPEHGKAQNYT